MSLTPHAIRSWSLAAVTAMITVGLLAAPVGNAAVDCPAGWEFGPSLKLKQSDGWLVTVAASGRGIGGPAVAMPPDESPLWRGTGEGGSDGITVAFGIGWDNGIVTHYTGVVDQSTGSVTGERPDGVTWEATAPMRCFGAPGPSDMPPPPA
ncbi:MAG: hypothetical protein ACRDU5_01980 [Mycobacterium sp.]